MSGCAKKSVKPSFFRKIGRMFKRDSALFRVENQVYYFSIKKTKLKKLTASLYEEPLKFPAIVFSKKIFNASVAVNVCGDIYKAQWKKITKIFKIPQWESLKPVARGSYDSGKNTVYFYLRTFKHETQFSEEQIKVCLIGILAHELGHSMDLTLYEESRQWNFDYAGVGGRWFDDALDETREQEIKMRRRERFACDKAVEMINLLINNWDECVVLKRIA